jgi:glycosyltransferase involved in cell wall biosynthesis
VTTPKRVAIVHEWFTSMRGGEKCVEAMCEVFPQAEIFTLLHNRGSVSPIIERHKIHTSFIQRLPLARERYRYYLPLFPTAIQQFDLSEFDLVISSNHCVAKGVRVPPGTLHLCYCYTPMRYIWDLYDDYFGKDRAGLATRAGMRIFRDYLRRWDVATAKNPRKFIAISDHVRKRIAATYHREADVIYPPVNTSYFPLSNRSGDYFLIVGAFVPYKRVDLAIQAFNALGERLVIIGDGPEMKRLQAIAGPTIELLGWQSDEAIREYYAGCKALIFPGEEDFGIVPVEAMASGKPVIAYAKGGATETVIDNGECRTGILFAEQTVESLAGAVGAFRADDFTPQSIRDFALRFDREEYKKRVKEYADRAWTEFALHSPNR